MSAQQILKQYQDLRRAMPDAKLPVLEAVTYSLMVKFETLTTVEAVYNALDSFNPISGWIDYQSGKQHFLNSPLEIRSDYDMLLNAEVASHGAALHVRYNGNGGWLVTRYDYGEGNEYIVDKIDHLASFAKGSEITTLKYLRFWKEQNGLLGVNPVFACFIGFGGTQ